MAYTYDGTQATEADEVKFHLGQVGTTAATRDLSDEEITAVLNRMNFSGRAKIFQAAVECLRSVLIRHGIVGGGIERKKISKLEITYGGRSTKADVLLKLMDSLRNEAAFYSRGSPRSARFVNATGYDGG